MDPTGIGAIAFIGVILFILAIYVGYPLTSIIFGFHVRRKLRDLGKRRVLANLAGFFTALSLLLLPFADYPWYRYKINKYCSQQAGFNITSSVEGVEGVHGLRRAISYGYSYGEVYLKPGDPTSLHRYYPAPRGSKTGKFLSKKTDKQSQYGFRRERDRIDGSIFRVTLRTYITENEKELGRFVYFENDTKKQGFSFNDFRKWMRMTCDGVKPYAWAQARELLNKTLIPSSKITNIK